MKRFFLLLFLVIFFLLYRNKVNPVPLNQPLPQVAPISTMPTRKTFKPIEKYNPPKIKNSPSYTIIFLGDSMTAALGENFDELRKSLSQYYPDKTFGLFNYGFGSTNIFSVDERLNSETKYLDKTYPPILDRFFDIVIIESFGYNPLSEYPLSQGLIHQKETTDQIVAQIVSAKPEALIVFLATIAPSKTLYAQGVVKFTPEERSKQAQERIAYIENHIAYAQSHDIPLIDVYHKSLDQNGQAITRFINRNDYIHPSSEGIKLISQTITDYLNENNLLPH